MRPVSSKDIYVPTQASIISDSDVDIMVSLYLPMIGAMPFAIYVALVRQAKDNDSSVKEHALLFARLQLTSGQFRKGVEALEAVGLVKTYLKKDGDRCEFKYALYAPKDPSSFFQDPLLLGTLRKYLGEEEVSKIHARYKIEEAIDGFEDVSSGFSEYFNPDFADPIYQGRTLLAIPHQTGKIRTGFDIGEFQKALGDLGYEKLVISKSDLSLIEKYGSLYGITGEGMGIIVANCLDFSKPASKRIDFAKVEQMCITQLKYMPSAYRKGKSSNVSAETAIAAKIRLMDNTAPMQFLSILQGNRKPAKSDIKLVNTLALDMGLPGPCVNALIDYVLQTNNNVLSASYCEKLAAYLVREGVMTARDAMDKLTATRKRKSASSATSKRPQDNTENPAETTQSGEQNLDQEVDDFLKELYGDK